MSRPVASSDKNRSPAPLLLLLACALLCTACAPAGGQNPPPLKIVKESQHANGLVVGLPEGFEARQTDDGFVVEPSSSQSREVRNPAVAGVSLVKGDAPHGPALKSKTVGEKEVHYRVTQSEGGSGGEVYTLEVYERVEGGHVRYTQATQSEMGEPDFALCWTLAGSTKYQPRNN